MAAGSCDLAGADLQLRAAAGRPLLLRWLCVLLAAVVGCGQRVNLDWCAASCTGGAGACSYTLPSIGSYAFIATPSPYLDNADCGYNITCFKSSDAEQNCSFAFVSFSTQGQKDFAVVYDLSGRKSINYSTWLAFFAAAY